MLSPDKIETAKRAFADVDIGETRDEPPPVNAPEDYKRDNSSRADPADEPSIKTVTPAEWPDEKPQPVDWLADQRIPRGDVSTMHGDGGAGKTDIVLQLAANCARAADYWMGHAITTGPVVIVSAEEPEREIRRRMDLHAERGDYALNSITNLHLWFPDDVAGATLATPDRSGIMRPTSLYESIKKRISDLAPVLVIIDNVAATFAGNQNDRVMVRSYVNLWRAIAHGPGNPAVLLLDHPSLSGLTNGTGRGGNMDWRNAVRCALFLKSPDDKAEADRGVRILETQKSNCGPIGMPIRLQWSNGGLALEGSPGLPHRLAKDTECDEIFLRLLDARNGQGRDVSDKPSSTYAPKIFSDMEGNCGFTKRKFATAMDRLFHAKKIAVEKFGPPSRQ
jgi:RecA-family ATPase